MPFTKASSSQHSHNDGVGCVLQVRGKPFGLLISSESAIELLEFNTQRWWPLPNTIPQNNGSSHGTNTSSVRFNTEQSNQQNNNNTVNNRGGCAVASLGSLVYQVGGIGNENDSYDKSSNACQSFEFGAPAWHSLPAMNQARSYPAAIGVGNDIGEGGNGDADGDKSYHQNNGGTLYVLGGRDGWDVLNTVEALDVASHTWTKKANFATPRMAPAVVALSSTTLLVVGGYTGQQWTTSLELYSISSDSWNIDREWKIPSLPVPLAFPKAFVIPSDSNKSDNEDSDSKISKRINRIIVIGTSILKPTSGNSTYTAILSYRFKTGRWSKLVSGVTRQRNGGRTLLPPEGCTAGFDPDLLTLYTVGGRSKGRPMQASSTQVLKWNLPALYDDDVNWMQSLLQLPPATMQSPRNRLHRTGSAITSTGSVTSGIPFSTIQLDENDEASEAESMVETIFSSASQRKGPRSTTSNHHHRNRSSLDMSNNKNFTTPYSISEEQQQQQQHQEEDSVETTHTKDGMEWTDASGLKGIYTGTIIKSDGITPHGKGHFVSSETGDFYEGGWRHGRRHGYGRWKYEKSGDVFEGWFVDDRRQGRGTFQWADGRQFEGLYDNDLAEDPNGTLTWKNGTIFVGTFSRGLRTGRGVIRFPNNVRYAGEWQKGKYHGFGTCSFAGGKVYTGHWFHGQAHGQGRLVEADGTVVHDGKWEFDAPVLASK